MCVLVHVCVCFSQGRERNQQGEQKRLHEDVPAHEERLEDGQDCTHPHPALCGLLVSVLLRGLNSICGVRLRHGDQAALHLSHSAAAFSSLFIALHVCLFIAHFYCIFYLCFYFYSI